LTLASSRDALSRRSRADIGGSLIKLVYFSPDTVTWSPDGQPVSAPEGAGGRLHFLKARL
jgi:hypothetical protein